MEVLKDVSLKAFNTFGIEAKADLLMHVKSVQDLREVYGDENLKEQEKLILGGGSNILLTKDFKGLVMINSIQGRSIVKESDDHVWVKVGGGEVWHEFVLWTISEGWGGVENLSLIPGSVGAAPMQNIGAYGVELKDSFYELEAFNKETGKVEVFQHSACEFGYRTSVFKTALKDRYVIVNVTFCLNKKPIFNTSYGAIEKQLQNDQVEELSLKAVSDAVIVIRESKLPDPKKIGNSGSFFKNPIISREQFDKLIVKYPDVAHYDVGDGNIKIAAGWLIDKSGWKGKRFGEYGVHEKQALVLVNYSSARGNDIYQLSEDIMEDVRKRFGIELEREVNVI